MYLLENCKKVGKLAGLSAKGTELGVQTLSVMVEANEFSKGGENRGPPCCGLEEKRKDERAKPVPN